MALIVRQASTLSSRRYNSPRDGKAMSQSNDTGRMVKNHSSARRVVGCSRVTVADELEKRLRSVERSQSTQVAPHTRAAMMRSCRSTKTWYIGEATSWKYTGDPNAASLEVCTQARRQENW